MAKTVKGHFKETTVEIDFNGKKVRVHPNVKKAIEAKAKAKAKK